jgi:hypothetical protein
MPTAPAPSAEFVGKAREFRRRIEASDLAATDVIDRVAMPLIARRNRHPMPRAEMLAGAAHEWRKLMPEAGRLNQSIKLNLGRKSLDIEEVRMSSSQFRRAPWATDEPGVSLIRLSLNVAPRKLDVDLINLGAVSLHALARRLHRAFLVTDEAVIADLLVLADAHAALIAQHVIGTDISVACTDNRARQATCGIGPLRTRGPSRDDGTFPGYR